MTKKLNRQKEFGTLHPPYKGAMFEQECDFYGGDEVFLFRELPEDTAPKAERRRPAPQPAPPEPEEFLDDEPEPEGPAPSPGGPLAEDKPIDDGLDIVVDDINLTAWAKGKVKYPFFKVKKAAEHFSEKIDTTSTKTIIAGLVSLDVLTAKEAKT